MTALGKYDCKKLISTCGKFTAVSREIWQTTPQNLEKLFHRWAAASSNILSYPSNRNCLVDGRRKT